MTARRFILDRIDDETGVSGTGAVAEGCVFSNGRAALTFVVAPGSMLWYLSVDDLMTVHGHGGKTQLVWIDPPA